MNDISPIINHATCMRCCRCVMICPMHHLEFIGVKIELSKDSFRTCLKCGHCMSVCPTRSVVALGYDYSDFTDLPDTPPDSDAVLRVLKARRSMRHFQDKLIDPELIEKIIDAASTAPFGVPPTPVELAVVNGRQKIEELLSEIMIVYEGWIRTFGNPIMRGFFILTGMGKMLKFLVEFIIPSVKEILKGRSEGRDLLTYGAPAMIVFHSEASQGPDNCIIAMTVAMIAAESYGLGTCIIGMIPPAIERSRKLREMLKIPKGNKIYGALLLGWPKATFNRSIPRKFKSVTRIN